MVIKLLVVSNSTSPTPPLLLIACHSSPPSSITSPVSEDLSHSLSSPELAFQDLSMNDPDPLQAYQYPPDLSFLANDQPYQTPPKQSFFQPVALPEVFTPNMSVIPDHNVGINLGINNAGAIPGSNSFPAVPPFSETTALGLYYPSTPQSLEIPPFSTQADASILSALPPSTNSRDKTRKVRAVVPTARTKRVRSGKMHAVATAAAAIAASTAFGTGKNGILECDICGFRPTTSRKADFLRHEKTHQDTQYVCYGIPDDHPAAAGLDPMCSVRLYKGNKFLGGCGKPYSRMDALQRHSGKSGCACGTAKEYEIWRQEYF